MVILLNCIPLQETIEPSAEMQKEYNQRGMLNNIKGGKQ